MFRSISSNFVATMKKITSRKTTSTKGVMSMPGSTRFRR
jgi:hypothetical protein